MKRRTTLSIIALAVMTSGQAAAVDTTPPPIPVSTVEPKPISCHTVELSWYGTSDDDSPDASGLSHFRVYSGGLLLTETQATPPVPNSARKYRATGLSPGVTYSFSVSAVDRAGNESAQLNFAPILIPVNIPQCIDTTPPEPPTNIIANLDYNTAYCGDGRYLVSTSGEDSLSAFRLYRNGVLINEATARPPETHSYVFELGYGLIPHLPFNYSVTSVDSAGNESSPSAAILQRFGCESPRLRQSIEQGGIPVHVVGVTFPDYPNPPSPFEDIEKSLFDISSPRVPNLNHYLGEISQNIGGLLQIRETYSSKDWIQLSLPRSSHCTAYPSGTYGSCSHQSILTDLRQSLGESFPQDDGIYIIYLAGVSDSSTVREGVVIRADRPVLDATSTLFHEFGHALGIQHAASLERCPGYSTRFPGIGPDPHDPVFGCVYIGTGGRYSPMATGNIRYYSAHERSLIGLLHADQIRLGNVTGTADFLLTAIERAPFAGETQLLYVPLNEREPSLPPYLALEYRTPHGYDGIFGSSWGSVTDGTFATDRVTVHIIPERFPGGQSSSILVGTLTTSSPTFLYEEKGIVVELIEMGTLASPTLIRVTRD